MDRTLRIQMIFAASNKATGPMREVASGSGQMAKALKASRDEVDGLNAKLKLVDGYRMMRNEARGAARDTDAARLKVHTLAQAYAAAEKPTKAMARELGHARKEADKAATSHARQSQEVSRLHQELVKAGLGAQSMGAFERSLRSDVVKTTAAMSAQQDRLDRLGRQRATMTAAKDRFGATNDRAGQVAQVGGGMVAAGLAAGLPLAAVSREAMTFQGRLVDIQKVLPNLQPPELNGFQATLTQLSTKIPIVREQLALIAAEGARAGVASDPRLSMAQNMAVLATFTENAAKMGAAFEMEAGDAGQTMAQWSSSMGLAQPQVVALADKVNALTNKFGGNAANVTDIVTRLGALGKVSGVAGGEIAAMGQFLDKAGVQSEIGATGLKNMMLALTKGSAATKMQSAAFGRLGIDSVKLSERMQTDARGGILSVLDAIALLPKAQQSGILTQLFGSESVSAIAPLLSGLDQVKANFALVGDEAQWAGSMNSEFATAMTKTENQAKLAANAGKNLGGDIGMALLPTITAASQAFVKVTAGLTGFLTAHPNVAKGLGLIAVGLALVLIVAGGLALGVAAVMGPFAALQFALTMAPLAAAGAATAFGVMGGAIATVGRAMLMNPIGLAITGIALAAFLIYRNWGPISKWFGALWSDIKSKTGAAVDWVGAKIKSFELSKYLPKITWDGFIPNLDWSKVKPLAWANLIKKVDWRIFVPVVGWSHLAGEMIWTKIIKPLGWDKFIPKINWGKFGPSSWASMLPKWSWSSIIPAIKLASFIAMPGAMAAASVAASVAASTLPAFRANPASNPARVSATAGTRGLPPLQRRASGGAFGPGPLLTGERGPELEYANRAGFIAHHGQLRDLVALSQRLPKSQPTAQMIAPHAQLSRVFRALPVQQAAITLPAAQMIAPQAQLGPRLIERTNTQSLIERDRQTQSLIERTTSREVERNVTREVQAKAPPQLAGIAAELGKLFRALPVQQAAITLPAAQMIAPQAQLGPRLIERGQQVQDRVAQFTQAQQERAAPAVPNNANRQAVAGATYNPSFHFNVAPGTDPAAIAQEVKRILRELKNEGEARARSTFNDDYQEA